MQNKIISLKLDRNLIILALLIGMLLNVVAMASNDWRMPVKTNYIIDTNKHFNFEDREEIKYYQLSDIYKINLMNGKKMYISVGDLLIWICSLALLIYQIRIINLEIKLKKIKD